MEKKKSRSDFAEADHCHHRRYPVRPVPSGRLRRFVVTLSGFFSTFLKFVILLMILLLCDHGIMDLSQGAGKLLLITVALAYGSTL